MNKDFETPEVTQPYFYSIKFTTQIPFYRRLWFFIKAPFTYIFQGKFEI